MVDIYFYSISLNFGDIVSIQQKSFVLLENRRSKLWWVVYNNIYIHTSQSNEIHLIKDNYEGLHQKLTMPQKKWCDRLKDGLVIQ
jgi:hypothetical protein